MPARPLFVIGAARAGTTLVRALLGAHPSIELRNEPELILSLIRAGIGPEDAVPREDRLPLLFALARTGLTRQHIASLPADTVVELLTSGEQLGLKAIYELLLPRPAGDVVWGEKSLGNAYLMAEIAATYPDALFLHVLRDPRATTMSYAALRYLEDGEELELDRQAIAFVAYQAMRWASWTDTIDRAAEGLPHGALTRVRFEELVEDPATVLERVCTELALDFDGRMLDPDRRRDDPVLDSRQFAHRRLPEPVNAARARAGDQLPAWAAAVVERYAGEGMARHRYSRRSEQPPGGQRERLLTELDLLEPILRQRLARDLSRNAPHHGRSAFPRPGATEAGSRTEDSLSVLAAMAVGRRGVGAEPETEVEALRAFAAEALDRLEQARAARARLRRRSARVGEGVKARDAGTARRPRQGKRAPKGEGKRAPKGEGKRAPKEEGNRAPKGAQRRAPKAERRASRGG